MSEKPTATESIAERAYHLWEQAGRPSGREEEFWFRAKADLAPATAAGGVPPVIPPPRSPPASVSTSAPLHQVPPTIKDAVEIPARRVPKRKTPKRA